MNFRYVLNELRRRHHRTLVNVLGVAIGIALFVSINAVSTAYHEAVSAPFKNIGADLVVQKPEKRAVSSAQTPAAMRGIRLPFSNRILSPDELSTLSTLKGVSTTSASLLLWEFDASGFKTIMGVDLSKPSLGPVKVKEWLKEGRFPEKEGEVVVEKHFAKFRHVKRGGTMMIGGKPFDIVGLLEIREGSQVASANVYLTLDDAQDLSGEARGVNVVYLRLANPSLLDKVKAGIGRELPAMSVTSVDSFLEVMGGVSKVSDQFALIVSLVALAGAVLLIIKTMLANLVARSAEIGVLKAVGWTRANVQKQLLAEALLQSLAGGILGLAAGYGISCCLGFFSIPVSTPWQVNLMPALARAEAAATAAVRLPVSVSPGLVAAALGLSVLTGALATLFLTRRTARIKPADILRKL